MYPRWMVESPRGSSAEYGAFKFGRVEIARGAGETIKTSLQEFGIKLVDRSVPWRGIEPVWGESFSQPQQ
jgi:hypothetical protein